MARYIDADWIYEKVENRYRVSSGIEHRCERDLLDLICQAPTADVVPKSEVEELKADLEVWKQNRFNIFQMLELYKMTMQEAAREIFEEIENWFELYSEREYSFAEEEKAKEHYPEAEAHDYALDIINDLRTLCIAELKKKYTE